MKLTDHRKLLLKIFLIVVMSIAFVKCVVIDSIDYPESVEAGETITMTMHTSFEPSADRNQARLVIGFLAPNSWNAAENTTIEYTSTYGNGTMSLIPEGATAPNSGGEKWPEGIRNKFGIGGNLLDNVEWVVFQSDETHNIGNGADGTADIDITTTVGEQNMLVKLGFFIGNDFDGLSNSTDAAADWNATQKAEFTECIEVTEGEGNIIDFCNPQLNTVVPSAGLDNDIVTFAYQGDVAENSLENADPVYFCATGYTDAETTYEVCEPGEKTRMIKASEFQNIWELTMWPRRYFNIGEDEMLTRVEYSFTNEDGSIELINEAISAPFTHFFICE